MTSHSSWGVLLEGFLMFALTAGALHALHRLIFQLAALSGMAVR